MPGLRFKLWVARRQVNACMRLAQLKMERARKQRPVSPRPRFTDDQLAFMKIIDERWPELEALMARSVSR